MKETDRVAVVFYVLGMGSMLIALLSGLAIHSCSSPCDCARWPTDLELFSGQVMGCRQGQVAIWDPQISDWACHWPVE